MAAPLRAAPEPIAEPIVLVVEGQTFVIEPTDALWPVAYHAREKEEQLKLAERDLRGKRTLIKQLNEDKAAKEEQERIDNPAREMIERLFDLWRRETGKLRCKLTPERFDMTAARIGEGYDEVALTMAVVGIATNPYTIEGERKDDYKTVMQSGEQVERYANRCAADRRKVIREELCNAGKLFDLPQTVAS